jgi:[ribosomal protein S18]-alanine N-acetyltransferase
MKGPILTPLLVTAGPEAIDSVMSVMEDAFDANYGEAWNRDQCLGIIGLPGVWLTLALYDDRIAGFTLDRIIVDEAELLLIAVAPELHARGIGSMLLNAAIKSATNRGATKLHLEVRDGNPANALYRRFGFAPVGRRRAYYHGQFGQSFDALTLTRSLQSGSTDKI